MIADKIVGHSSTITTLLQDKENGNVSHAYLFSGEKHTGKTTLARWFAGELLCDGSLDEHCLHQVEHLLHPDLSILDELWIEDICEDWQHIAKYSNAPQNHRAKKPPAKTDSISIDDVRHLSQRLGETSVGTYRVCIITGIERMQDPAANALLKILEEPPQGLVFLLTTNESSSLLPTIVSRTRVVHVQRVSPKEIASLLEETDEDDKAFILSVSQGKPGLAIRLRDDPDLLREHRIAHTQARAFWDQSSLSQRISALSPLLKRGEDADRLLLHLALSIRDRGSNNTDSTSLVRLSRGLSSNIHRGLLVQQFALSVQ